MAQNITLLGASYPAVPSVLLPKTGGGTAQFDDTTVANAGSGDIVSGKSAFVNGSLVNGSLNIVTYYTGSSAPSSGTGSNNDIYLQTN